MKIRTHVITGVWLVGQLHAQTLIDLSKQTRNVNFSAASATTPWSIGASLPASCTTGQAYYLTGQLPTQSVFICSAGGQWTAANAGSSQFSTGSGDPVSNCTAGQDYVDTTNQNIWVCAAANVWLRQLATSDSGNFVMTGLNGTAPTTPGSGTTSLFFASARIAQTIDDAGNAGTMVRPTDCSVSNQAVQKINADGTISCGAGGSGGSGSGGPVTVTRYFPAAAGSSGSPRNVWPTEDGAIGSQCSATVPECWMRWYSDGSSVSWAGFSDVVPTGWVSGSVVFSVRFIGNGLSDQWGVSYACQGSNVADPPTLTGVINLNAISGTAGYQYVSSATLPMTGCTAGSLITFNLTRVDTHGYVNLLGAELSYVTP